MSTKNNHPIVRCEWESKNKRCPKQAFPYIVEYYTTIGDKFFRVRRLCNTHSKHVLYCYRIPWKS